MNPYKIAFTLFGLIYAGIALFGLTVAMGVTLAGLCGLLWCSAGWWISDRYLGGPM